MCRSGSDSDSGSGSGSGSSDSSAEENSDESVSDYEPSHKVKSRKPSNKYSFHLVLLLLPFYVVMHQNIGYLKMVLKGRNY